MSEGYVFVHEDKAYSPDGLTDVKTNEAIEHNKRVDAEMIEWLKTGPDRVLLYVYIGEKRDPNRLGSRLTNGGMSRANGDDIQVRTWLGTRVSTHEYIGPRVNVGFDRWTYRRSVSCRLFGVLYHGWYMESSGDYCRLKKAKRQG